jgi:hypothetical protein
MIWVRNSSTSIICLQLLSAFSQDSVRTWVCEVISLVSSMTKISREANGPLDSAADSSLIYQIVYGVCFRGGMVRGLHPFSKIFLLAFEIFNFPFIIFRRCQNKKP